MTHKFYITVSKISTHLRKKPRIRMDSLGVHSSGETEASSSDLKVYCEDDVAFTSDDLTRLMMQSLHNLGYRFIHLWFKNVISITF